MLKLHPVIKVDLKLERVLIKSERTEFFLSLRVELSQIVHVINPLQSDALRKSYSFRAVLRNSSCARKYRCTSRIMPTKISLILSIAVFDAEIGGDIKKFSSTPKLVAYSGIYPTSRQSCETKTDGHMSKNTCHCFRRPP